MSYEVLEKQIRALPEEALEDVSIYLDKIGLIYQSKKAVDFSFVDNIFGTPQIQKPIKCVLAVDLNFGRNEIPV